MAAIAGTVFVLAGGVYWWRSRPRPEAAASYVSSGSCAGCHQEIAASYRKTGMARGFARFDASRTPADFTRANVFHHAASDRHYRMYLRDGSAHMRRHQNGFDGRETNVLERRIDYAMGSGNKAVTFLHRNARGELIELPVTWYTGNGGYWAMSPSYDRPDHNDFRHRIRYDCFFCHNAYPQTVAGKDSFYGDAVYPEPLPNGIDCQRCHGPGSRHVAAASPPSEPEAIRASILNPRRLDPVRAMEVCMQCHLQSTSRPLPYAVIQPGRGVFSYRAGEPLGNYIVHFDHEAASGHDGKFEIAHAAYRLRQSKCFLESANRLTCTTCHNPHHAAEPPGRINTACRSCHAAAHDPGGDCARCHMPQRRAEDVVHAVMTDHRIQRDPPPGNPLAPRAERVETPGSAYRGQVVLYGIHRPGPDNEVARAIAQVRSGANPRAGLRDLERLLADGWNQSPEAWYELAEAYWQSGDAEKAFAAHKACLAAGPRFSPCLRAYGMELASTGRLAEATAILERAREVTPDDGRTLHDLGLTYLKSGRAAEGLAVLREAAAKDPDSAETHNAIAAILIERNDAAGAEAALREAIRVRPDYAMAHANLAQLLDARGDPAQATYHRRKAGLP